MLNVVRYIVFFWLFGFSWVLVRIYRGMVFFSRLDGVREKFFRVGDFFLEVGLG